MEGKKLRRRSFSLPLSNDTVYGAEI